MKADCNSRGDRRQPEVARGIRSPLTTLRYTDVKSLDKKGLKPCALGNNLIFQAHINDQYFLSAVLGCHLTNYPHRRAERNDGKRRTRTIHDQVSAGLS